MLSALLLLAQWLDHPDKNIPRTKDGKPVLTAKAPKTRDGRPDLSGIWLPDNTPGVKGTNGEPLPKYFISITWDMKNEDVPFTPDAAAVFRQNLAGNQKGDPTSTCHPIGVPAADTVPIPYNPKTFTRPITFTQPNTLTPDGDLLEYFCTDNEQDSAHFR